MKKTLKMKRLAAQIEWHWFFIVWERRTGVALLDSGAQLSSPRLNRLNGRLSRHCVNAVSATKKYHKLMGIPGE